MTDSDENKCYGQYVAPTPWIHPATQLTEDDICDLRIVHKDKIETLQAEVERLRDGIYDIADIAVDYDGFNTADELKKLVDDLREMALQLLEPNDES